MIFAKTPKQLPAPTLSPSSNSSFPDGVSRLAKVARRADLYEVVLEQQGDRWLAHIPAFPDSLAEGETPEAATKMVKAAVAARIFSPVGVNGLVSSLSPKPGMQASQDELVERELRQALARSEFLLHYQPTFELATGQMAGMEALIRWEHPRRGLLSAVDFIPLAEATGLSASMDDWVLDEACRELTRWGNTRGDSRPMVMSVNLSRGQVSRPNLAPHVVSVLNANGMDPSRVRMEVSEATAREEDASSSQNLQALRVAGVHLTLDDVSAEGSSLMHLRDLTVDSLKIDRSLVEELRSGSRTTALVQAITLLAHGWGMTVTAEGVETAEQAAILVALGCDYGQGYFYGRPEPSRLARTLVS
jgi:EAL domain-containing protein (putative c-di-GMP-specific phosphodiesterase class I)